MIGSQPLRQRKSLEKLAKALPKTLDDEGILKTLRQHFEADWPNLTPEVHQRAALAYRTHLERSLAIRCNQLLPSIFTKVERIEANTEKILDKLDSFSPQQAISLSNWYLPFPYNEKFVGRDADLKNLHAALQEGASVGVRPTMLSGMGGIGKTQLAVMYAYRFKEKYPGGIYWVNTAQDYLLKGMAKTAEKIGLRPTNDVPESQHLTWLANEFAKHLSSHKDALVIFDNVEDPKVLRLPVASFVPTELKCHILFTTRRRDPDLPFQSIDVRVLPDEIALELLLSSNSRKLLIEKEDSDPEKSAARMICKDLGGLPLALALASAYLGEFPSVTMEGYRQRLKEEGLRAVDESGADPLNLPTRHTEATNATLKSQWEALENDSAKDVVFTTSVLGEAVQVSYSLLRLLLQLPDETKPGYPKPLEAALNELTNLWLVEELTDEGLRLHPLIRKFALSELSDVDAFAQQASNNMATSLEDIPRLEREILRRGVDVLLADVRIGYSLRKINKSLQELERILDNEAHNLRKWEPNEQPAYLVQQLYNRAFARISQSWQSLLKKDLETKKHLWLEEKHPFSHVSLALLRTFEGHTDSVNSVAVTPDGAFAISVSDDKTLRLWDLETGELLRTVEGHADSIKGVAVAKNGTRVISVSEDRTLRLWNLENVELLQSFEIDTFLWYKDVAVTPDGARAITVFSDGILRLWDLESGEQLRSIEGHSYDIRCVTITPDGKRAIIAFSDGILCLWDLESGKQLRSFEGHTDYVDSIAVTPDGNRAISASLDKTLRLWDLESGEQLRFFEGQTDSVNSVVVTRDGKHAISASYDTILRLWDLESGEQLRSFEGHSESVNSVAVTPDGKRVISASADNSLRLWDLESGEQLRSFEGHTTYVNEVVVTPDGRYAISASDDNTLCLWDLESGKQLRSFEEHTGYVNGVAVTPDGRYAISASDDNTLRLWDLESGEQLRFKEHSSAVRCVTITPDGKRAISAFSDGTLCLWDLESGEQLRSFKGHIDVVDSVAVTPDGKRAISASVDKTLRLWDLESGEQLHFFGGHTDFVDSVAVTPDGKRAISASVDKTLRLWDLESGKQLRAFEGHSSAVRGAAVTPDGKRAISASVDKTLRLWDLESGKCLLLLSSEAPFHSVAINPNGKIIVAGDAQGVLHFIEIHHLE